MLTSTTLIYEHTVVADIHEVRKRNLKLLVTQWEGPTNLAKKLGYAGPSYVSQMVSGNRPITEKTARQIEAKADVPPGWLDQEHHQTAKTARPAAVDTGLMSRIISLVTTALEEAGVRVSSDKFADLVALVYEEAGKSGELDERFVTRIINLVK